MKYPIDVIRHKKRPNPMEMGRFLVTYLGSVTKIQTLYGSQVTLDIQKPEVAPAFRPMVLVHESVPMLELANGWYAGDGWAT